MELGGERGGVNPGMNTGGFYPPVYPHSSANQYAIPPSYGQEILGGGGSGYTNPGIPTY